MTILSQLKNTTRPKKKIQRVGRGDGSKRGKTSCRGSKGDGSRRGYDRRYGYEGGQVPLYRKLPVRGFTRGRFEKESFAISLDQIEKNFSDGELVSFTTLRAKGLIPRVLPAGVKILSNGVLTKKVRIEVHSVSDAAQKKLEAAAISLTLLKTNA